MATSRSDATVSRTYLPALNVPSIEKERISAVKEDNLVLDLEGKPKRVYGESAARGWKELDGDGLGWWMAEPWEHMLSTSSEELQFCARQVPVVQTPFGGQVRPAGDVEDGSTAAKEKPRRGKKRKVGDASGSASSMEPDVARIREALGAYTALIKSTQQQQQPQQKQVQPCDKEQQKVTTMPEEPTFDFAAYARLAAQCQSPIHQEPLLLPVPVPELTLSSTATDMHVHADEVVHRFVENPSRKGQMCMLQVDKRFRYAIPAQCRFALSDGSMARELLAGESVRMVLMDPPWQNKSLERSGRYEAMGEYDLLKWIPMHRILHRSEGVVAIWVTNKRKIIDFVKTVVFPQWKLTLVAEWYWLKVTALGEPVFPLEDAFDSPHTRKPWERLLIARRTEGMPVNSSTPTTAIQQRVLVCPAVKVHSLKPPIHELLCRELLPASTTTTTTETPLTCHQRLELFARRLQPGWTCWGNQVLQFQQMDRYLIKSGP